MGVEHAKFLVDQELAALKSQMEAMKRAAEMEAMKHASEMKAMKRASLATSAAASPPLSPPSRGLVGTPSLEPDLSQQLFIKQERSDDYSYSLPTPQLSHGIPSSSYPSPSVAAYSASSTPAIMGLDLDPLTASSDLTQHPAAVLIDLQCQSVETCQGRARPFNHQWLLIHLYFAQLVYLILITTVYSQLMHPLMMIFSTLRTGLTLPPSMMTTPMTTPLIRWLISTPANLVSLIRAMTSNRLTLTKKSLLARAPSSSEATRSMIPISRLTLLRRLLLSSPSLARPLRAATGRAMRPKTSSMTGDENGVREPSDVVRRVVRPGEKAGLKGGGVRRSLSVGGGQKGNG